MKLDRLHIQGFKSFKDRTTIHFDQGITGIVGPNGCGKSNIVDALFWVMGSQSAKHLRGKSMKDLIFSGSEKYNPASWAEVSLILKNDEEKHIHIGSQVVKPSEIQLTRKLYRNGETEYRINGEPARLKDIQEVFMDTGAGAKSYAIIAQGEINRLVQAKPEERRSMIEEVAGITKFKTRRQESMRKLESTEQNLNRLQDLQAEIYKNLKSLEKQADKANRAKSLQEKIKRHELISESHKEFDFINQYLDHGDKFETKTNLISELTENKKQVEETLIEERSKKEESNKAIETAQDNYNQQAQEFAKHEQKVDFLKKNIDEKNKQYERRANENAEILNDIEERTGKLSLVKVELEKLLSQNLDEAKMISLVESVDTLKVKLVEINDEIKAKSHQRDEIKEARNNFFQRKEANKSKLEEYSRQLEDIVLEIEELEKEDSSFTEKLLLEREKKEKVEQAYTEKQNELDQVEKDFSEAKDSYEKLNEEVTSLRNEKTYQEATLKSLLDVNAQFDQAFEATEEFVAEDRPGIELVGNLIETEAEYSKVVETISRSLLKTITFKDTNSRSDLINWIKNVNSNGIEFMIPSSESLNSEETIQRLELKGFAAVKNVQEIIQVKDQDLALTIKNLFNGYFIVDTFDLSVVESLSPELKFKAIIDREGKTLITNNGNAVLVHSLNTNIEAEGVVTRNNRIRSLQESLNELNENLTNLEERFNEAEKNFNDLSERQNTVRAEFIDLKTEFSGIKSSLEAKEGVKNSSEAKFKQLAVRKSELSNKRLELTLEEENIDKGFSGQDSELGELDKAILSLEEDFSSIQDKHQNEKSELSELQALAKTFDSQRNGFESQINDNEGQLERYQDKLSKNREFQEALKLEIENLSAELEGLSSSLDEEKKLLDEKKTHLGDLKNDYADLLSEMQDRENQVRDFDQKLNKLERDCVEHKVKIEKAIENEELVARGVFEKYQIDLRSSIGEFLEITKENKFEKLIDISNMFFMETEEGQQEIAKNSFTFVKKFPGEVRESRDKFKRYRSELRRLGEINWQAAQDYEHQKLRHDFLKSQEVELKDSLEDLQVAIDHIDQKSRERFKLAFDEVNTRFMKVFPIIFGGGEARLNIVGHIDSPECGIDIIAQPPGKKMQSINLMSGGEKAMTAVSLIFSIFLVKPSPFCLLDEVDAPLDDANVGRFNELLREMSSESQFILITHNKKTMELNDTLYGVTMQEPGVSSAVSVQLH